MMIAGAMPPAAHIVTRPRLRSRRSSSSRIVPIRIEPVAPIGWPSAIEPPLTLTFSRSSLRSRMNFSATTANASLISNRSISSSVRPALASTLRAAGTGAFSIEVGILVEDELAIGRALVVEHIVGNRRKCRLQAGQSFQRGLRPRIFLTVEREAAVFAVDRHEAFVEMSALDG